MSDSGSQASSLHLPTMNWTALTRGRPTILAAHASSHGDSAARREVSVYVPRLEA
jgi:hypothetical protein